MFLSNYSYVSVFSFADRVYNWINADEDAALAERNWQTTTMESVTTVTLEL